MSNLKEATVKEKKELRNVDISMFIGNLVSFNNSLKLYHWHVSGIGSYAQHIALDQAIETMVEATDRITETSYAMKGDLFITIPETKNPGNIIKHTEQFYDYVESSRKFFSEDFVQSIIDDYQEAIQQLLYRMKRLE